jgi:single-stranded DNA-binding protein
MQFLDPRPQGQTFQPQQQQSATPAAVNPGDRPQSAPVQSDFDDDIPF